MSSWVLIFGQIYFVIQICIMSKQETLTRHRIIIQKLRTKPCSFELIQFTLEDESQIKGMDLNIELRTFQRDIKEIESLYQIVIKYNRGLKAYEIVEDQQDELSERLFEALDIYQMMDFKHSVSKFIQFESRSSFGSEHLSGLLYAIQNRFQIQFRYQKFFMDQSELRSMEPYLIKEFRNRWYVYGFDLEVKEFRTFGLDRMSALNISSIKFQFPQKTDARQHFKNSFGIIGASGMDSEQILLKLTDNQGNYVRTVPLHHSQKIVKEEGDTMWVSLDLVPTYDFQMELLTHGSRLEVLEPLSLRENMKTLLENMVANYREKN